MKTNNNKTSTIAVLVLSTVLCFSSFSAKGQQPQQYLDCTNCSDASNNSSGAFNYATGATSFNTNDVTSDFGPRRIFSKKANSVKYDWHGGLDFARDDLKGDAVCALDDGTIFFIGITDGIVDIAIRGNIGNYAYRHLFYGNSIISGNQAGRFVYMVGIDRYNKPFNAIFDTQDLIAYSTDPTHKIKVNGQIIGCTNIVQRGAPIAPIGNSGDGGYATHLHVQGIQDASLTGPALWSDNNACNPLKFIQHQSPTYSLTFIKSTISDVFTDAIPASEAGIVMQNAEKKKTPILFRARMLNEDIGVSRFNTSVFNIDKISLEIKKTSQTSFSVVKGTDRDASISYGGETTPSDELVSPAYAQKESFAPCFAPLRALQAAHAKTCSQRLKHHKKSHS